MLDIPFHGLFCTAVAGVAEILVRADLGYDHVVLLLALIKLDYDLTSTSWPSSSGLRGRKRTNLTILKRTWSAHSKMAW
jgi:hypothetical protein